MKNCRITLSNPFAKRLAISKSLGFLVGLIGFTVLPFVWDEATPFLQWGVLFWYTTVGAIVGMMGIITKHPAMPCIKIPVCLRGAIIGGWMNFVLIFFAYDTMAAMLQAVDILGIHSPWWFIGEGIIIGIFIDKISTVFAGEGKKITKDLE